jgi:hypothetical protein
MMAQAFRGEADAAMCFGVNASAKVTLRQRPCTLRPRVEIGHPLLAVLAGAPGIGDRAVGILYSSHR